MAPLLLKPLHMHRLLTLTLAFGLTTSCSTSDPEPSTSPQGDAEDAGAHVADADVAASPDTEGPGPELPTAQAPPRRKFGSPVASPRYRGRVSVGPEAIVGAVSSPRHVGRIGHAVGPSFTLLPREDAQ
ncbi:MAG: hypothetical protein IV100_19275 [Myxococcales bacterium]|nr:hypothetical protein [Myxococcales bacterium]